MIKKEQLIVASGLSRALDGVKSELQKLANIASTSELQDEGKALVNLAHAVACVSLSLENKARERYIAERQGKV
jgi:hypothetical protein